MSLEDLMKKRSLGAISDREYRAAKDALSSGPRPKTKRDGMKPCVKGNCGQKPLTGKSYKDYI